MVAAIPAAMTPTVAAAPTIFAVFEVFVFGFAARLALFVLLLPVAAEVEDLVPAAPAVPEVEVFVLPAAEAARRGVAAFFVLVVFLLLDDLLAVLAGDFRGAARLGLAADEGADGALVAGLAEAALAALAGAFRAAARLGLAVGEGAGGALVAGLGEAALAALVAVLRGAAFFLVLVPAEGGLLLAIILSIAACASTVINGHGSETTPFSSCQVASAPQRLPPVTPFLAGHPTGNAGLRLATRPIFEQRDGGQSQHDPTETGPAPIGQGIGLPLAQGGVPTQHYSDHKSVHDNNGRDSDK